MTRFAAGSDSSRIMESMKGNGHSLMWASLRLHRNKFHCHCHSFCVWQWYIPKKCSSQMQQTMFLLLGQYITTFVETFYYLITYVIIAWDPCYELFIQNFWRLDARSLFPWVAEAPGNYRLSDHCWNFPGGSSNEQTTDSRDLSWNVSSTRVTYAVV